MANNIKTYTFPLLNNVLFDRENNGHEKINKLCNQNNGKQKKCRNTTNFIHIIYQQNHHYLYEKIFFWTKSRFYYYLVIRDAYANDEQNKFINMAGKFCL